MLRKIVIEFKPDDDMDCHDMNELLNWLYAKTVEFGSEVMTNENY